MKKAGNVAVEISLLTRVKKGTHRVAIPVELLTLFNYRCSKKKVVKLTDSFLQLFVANVAKST